MKRVKTLMLNERIKDGKELRLTINTSLSCINDNINALKAEVQKPVADFEVLKDLCALFIRSLPLPIFMFDNNFVLRARPNYYGEVFQKTSEISYNPIISKVGLGRFNLPNDPVFYGAASMSDMNYNGPVTSICESYKQVFDENVKIKEQYLTIGKWDVIKPIPLLILTFYDIALMKNTQVQNINPVFDEFINLSCNNEDDEKMKVFPSILFGASRQKE